MNRNLEGQQVFNLVVGMLILAVVVNLLWVNWALLTAAREDRLPQNCDLACLTSEAKKIFSAEFAKMAIEAPQPVATSTAQCDVDCINELIEQKLSSRTPSSEETVPVINKPTPTAAKQSVSYYNLSGGAAAAGDWTAIDSTFWLDLSLYGGNVTVTWEGWLTVKDGNGIGYVRLYDLTNNREVDGSRQVISSPSSSFYSGTLSIWRGTNQYRIEVKSTTGYEVSISSPRLKIVSQ